MQIDKHIPAPSPRKWHDMEVGDSVLYPDISEYNRARYSAYNHGRAYGKKFSCRKTKEGGRIWRTK